MHVSIAETFEVRAQSQRMPRSPEAEGAVKSARSQRCRGVGRERSGLRGRASPNAAMALSLHSSRSLAASGPAVTSSVPCRRTYHLSAASPCAHHEEAESRGASLVEEDATRCGAAKLAWRNTDSPGENLARMNFVRSVSISSLVTLESQGTCLEQSRSA